LAEALLVMAFVISMMTFQLTSPPLLQPIDYFLVPEVAFAPCFKLRIASAFCQSVTEV
jgi:hypothetical protein